MATAEPIPVMQCPGCARPAVAPPERTLRAWRCPFCRRRYRRRTGRGRSQESSSTITSLTRNGTGIFEDVPGYSGLPRGLGRQLCHLLVLLYAGVLVGLIAVYYCLMTVGALLTVVVRMPLIVVRLLLGDSHTGSEWDGIRRCWLPQFHATNPDRRIGPILSLEDAPGLFALVDEIACKVRAPVPDELRITYLPCCGVIEQRSLLGLRRDRRILVIGLPFLYVLRVEELRAVLAHELAHFSGGDAALASLVSRFQASLDQAIGVGAFSFRSLLSPMTLLSHVTRALFMAASAPLSRSQEYRADLHSALLCGSNVAANSLRVAALVQPVFKEVLSFYHPTIQPQSNLYQFFRETWEAIPTELRREMLENLIVAEESGPLAPHPPLKARLAVIGQFPPHPEPDDRSAHRLLHNRKGVAKMMHHYVYASRATHLSVFHPSAGQRGRIRN